MNMRSTGRLDQKAIDTGGKKVGSTANGQQAARRKAALWMLFGFGIGVSILIAVLVGSAIYLPDNKDNQLIQGIVFTAIAGAISSFLSFMGLIVKGLVDNLTIDKSE